MIQNKLMLFLLEMGLVAGEKLKDASKAGYSLVVFALVAPLLRGIFGLILSWAIGLSQGGAVVFSILAASASYIAAPAAMRIAVPAANPTLSLTASLGVTFPINIFVGVPLYYQMAQWLHGQ